MDLAACDVSIVCVVHVVVVVVVSFMCVAAANLSGVVVVSEVVCVMDVHVSLSTRANASMGDIFIESSCVRGS